MGEQAFRANKWLWKAKTEKGEDPFAGRVYQSLMVTLDLTDPADAIYIENCVGAQDLVALGAEVRGANNDGKPTAATGVAR